MTPNRTKPHVQGTARCAHPTAPVSRAVQPAHSLANTHMHAHGEQSPKIHPDIRSAHTAGTHPFPSAASSTPTGKIWPVPTLRIRYDKRSTIPVYRYLLRCVYCILPYIHGTQACCAVQGRRSQAFLPVLKFASMHPHRHARHPNSSPGDPRSWHAGDSMPPADPHSRRSAISHAANVVRPQGGLTTRGRRTRERGVGRALSPHRTGH